MESDEPPKNTDKGGGAYSPDGEGIPLSVSMGMPDYFELPDGSAERATTLSAAATVAVNGSVGHIGLDRQREAPKRSPFENLDLSKIFELLLDDGIKDTLESFMSKDSLPHVEARMLLIDMFADRFNGKELNVDRLLGGVALGAFYSPNVRDENRGQSPVERHKGIKRGVADMASESFNASCNDPSSPHFFTKVAGYGSNGFSAETAASCPREILGLKEFGVVDGDNSEFLRYRLFFFELWHKAMAAFKNFGEGACHRETYTMAQITAAKTLAQFAEDGSDWVPIPPKGRKVPAPSLSLFEGKDSENPGDVQEIDSYIKANLSLILPDKKVGKLVKENGEFENLAQEEFVIFDLIALADRFNLYEKYREVFDAIFAYRRAQFTVNFHFNPDATKNPDSNKISLINILKEFYDRMGRLPFIGDWGDGKAQIGKLLLRLGVVSGVYGVDIDHDTDVDRVEELVAGRYFSTRIGVKGMGPEEIMKKIVEMFPRVDTLLACDVVHECSEPRRYIEQLEGKVNEGGVGYFTDPHHCEAVDKVTGATVYRLDSSKYSTSMISLEDWFDVNAYLTLKGWRVRGSHIVPGVAAGYNDPFWRGKHVLHKIPASERSPALYSVPKDAPYEEVLSPEIPVVDKQDYFKVWPLSLVPDAERERLLGELAPYMNAIRKEKKGEETPINLGNLRRSFLRALASSRNEDSDSLIEEKDLNGQLRHVRRDRLVYFHKVSNLFANFRGASRRQEVRESIYLIELLRDHFGMDLVDEVRRTPGWEAFELPSQLRSAV